MSLSEQNRAVGPRPQGWKCEGCPAFETEKWRESSGDGETYDRGQYAWCRAADRRSMGSYHYDHHATPDWCPALAARAEGVAALQQAGWRPIETAPKDGSIIDVWRPEGGRDTVLWGFPSHECGEMGRYCDSEWHSIRAPGWVCSTFNQLVGRKHAPFTHWMPLPSDPLPQQTALVEQGVEVAAYLIEQDDEPLAADLGARMNYWRDKCITAGQRLDPKRWGPK